MARRRAVGSGMVKDNIKTGFGLTLGSLLAMMIFIAIGAAIFIPGFVIVNKENAKKKKEEQNNGLKILGYILMFIGMIVGLGFGAGAFFGTVAFDIFSG